LRALIYKAGHTLIKARMKEVDSPIGVETSEQIFFKEIGSALTTAPIHLAESGRH